MIRSIPIPKRLWRVATLAFAALVFGIALLSTLVNKFRIHHSADYSQASSSLGKYTFGQSTSQDVEVEDKIIVVPTLQRDDTLWIARDLPDWQGAVYHVNLSNAEQPANVLTTPINKGHEAMVYLTYIIDNYERYIPSIVVFLHSHRGGYYRAWHVDTPLHDNVFSIRNLRLDYVLQKGYTNLRCIWRPGCHHPAEVNTHVTRDIWNEIFNETSTPIFNQLSGYPAAANETAGIDTTRIDLDGLIIETPCCAQFAVSKRTIYARPLDDYIKMRNWLMKTERPDTDSGRIFEFLWHIIFGMEARECLELSVCYCKVYGRC